MELSGTLDEQLQMLEDVITNLESLELKLGLDQEPAFAKESSELRCGNRSSDEHPPDPPCVRGRQAKDYSGPVTNSEFNLANTKGPSCQQFESLAVLKERNGNVTSRNELLRKEQNNREKFEIKEREQAHFGTEGRRVSIVHTFLLSLKDTLNNPEHGRKTILTLVSAFCLMSESIVVTYISQLWKFPGQSLDPILNQNTCLSRKA